MFFKIEGGKSLPFAVIQKARSLVNEQPDKFKVGVADNGSHVWVNLETRLGSLDDDSSFRLHLSTSKRRDNREVSERLKITEEGDFLQDEPRGYRVDIVSGEKAGRDLEAWNDLATSGLMPHPERVLNNYLTYANGAVVAVLDQFSETNMTPESAMDLLNSKTLTQLPRDTYSVPWPLFLQGMGGFEALKRLVLPD